MLPFCVTTVSCHFVSLLYVAILCHYCKLPFCVTTLCCHFVSPVLCIKLVLYITMQLSLSSVLCHQFFVMSYILCVTSSV